jgi:hypothetical protein
MDAGVEMQKFVSAISAGFLLLAGLPAVAKQTGEERLAKLLEGRVAGEPVRCISSSRARDMQIIDRTAIVYGSGSVIYVNRTKDASGLDSDDVVVTRNPSGQLCRSDTVRFYMRGTRTPSGFVNLDEFIPYRRNSK